MQRRSTLLESNIDFVENPHTYARVEFDRACFWRHGFEVTTRLGAGGYNVVMNGREIATGTTVAIKLNVRASEIAMAQYAADKNIGPRIIDIVECTISGTAMIMEKFDATFAEYIDAYNSTYNQPIPHAVLVKFIELLRKQYEARLVHGDFSVANILVKYREATALTIDKLVLSDFADSKIMPTARRAFWLDWSRSIDDPDLLRAGLFDDMLATTIGLRRGIIATWLGGEPRE